MIYNIPKFVTSPNPEIFRSDNYLVFDFWRNIDFTADVDVINKIRDDGIHILIDCSGHTKGNRTAG